MCAEPGPRAAGPNFFYEPVTVLDCEDEQRRAWREAVERVVAGMEALLAANPAAAGGTRLGIVALGVDTHKLDAHVEPAGIGKLSTNDIVWAVQRFRRVFPKLIILVEGGYALTGLTTGPFARTHLAVVRRSGQASHTPSAARAPFP